MDIPDEFRRVLQFDWSHLDAVRLIEEFPHSRRVLQFEWSHLDAVRLIEEFPHSLIQLGCGILQPTISLDQGVRLVRQQRKVEWSQLDAGTLIEDIPHPFVDCVNGLLRQTISLEKERRLVGGHVRDTRSFEVSPGVIAAHGVAGRGEALELALVRDVKLAYLLGPWSLRF